jgi:hypothetical protein
MALGYETERASFVTLVGRSSADAKVRSWLEAKQVVESFVWHSQTSDADALKLWIEVQRSTSRGVLRPKFPERLSSAQRRHA